MDAIDKKSGLLSRGASCPLGPRDIAMERSGRRPRESRLMPRGAAKISS